MHTSSKIKNSLVLLVGDYDARLASRNMELVDLETLESHEIIVRDYHPGTRLFYQESPDQKFSSTIIVTIGFDLLIPGFKKKSQKVASAASISICNNSK